MTMRQIMENDMTQKQHCETNRCSQQIYTIEHAHSAQQNSQPQTEHFETAQQLKFR